MDIGLILHEIWRRGYQIDLPPEKTTFKNPNLISIKVW